MQNFEIANLALDHLGITRKLASLADQTDEARAATRWYDLERQALLRRFHWTFAGAEKRAALVEDAINTHLQYQYAYTLPVDFLKARRLLVENYRNVPPNWEVPFQIGNSADGATRVLRTDLPDAYLSYTPNLADLAGAPEYFTTALSYTLAHRLIVPLRVVNKEIVANVRFGLVAALENAFIEDGGQHQKDPQPDACWILER